GLTNTGQQPGELNREWTLIYANRNNQFASLYSLPIFAFIRGKDSWFLQRSQCSTTAVQGPSL
ncbi:MAG: hypothetical protein L6437_09120, partial [Kiritimatiellae bacterium]|nr:hypothetical protein [Kiritimatiellia bacterium]